MRLTTDQKRQFLKLIAAGKANMNDFKDNPERSFIRVSPLPAQDEITLPYTDDSSINILPDVVFQCKEDGKQYLYSQVKEMHGNWPQPMTFYGIADNPPTEPIAIDSIEIMSTKREEKINSFLKNNY